MVWFMLILMLPSQSYMVSNRRQSSVRRYGRLWKLLGYTFQTLKLMACECMRHAKPYFTAQEPETCPALQSALTMLSTGKVFSKATNLESAPHRIIERSHGLQFL